MRHSSRDEPARYESEVSSHAFVFLHAWPAVVYQSTLSCADDTESGCAPANSLNQENADEDEENFVVTQNQEHEPELAVNPNANIRTVYIANNGQAHGISQYELYRHRVCNWNMTYSDPGLTRDGGDLPFKQHKKYEQQAACEQECGLRDFSFLQFCMHVTLKKLPQEGKLGKKNGWLPAEQSMSTV